MVIAPLFKWNELEQDYLGLTVHDVVPFSEQIFRAAPSIPLYRVVPITFTFLTNRSLTAVAMSSVDALVWP